MRFLAWKIVHDSFHLLVSLLFDVLQYGFENINIQ